MVPSRDRTVRAALTVAIVAAACGAAVVAPAGPAEAPGAPPEAGTVTIDLKAEWRAQYDLLAEQIRSAPRAAAEPVPASAASPTPVPMLHGMNPDRPMEASGVTAGPWYAVGPFDNLDGRGFAEAFPPEKGIDTTAQYVGKGLREIVWRKAPEIADRRITSLDRLGEREHFTAYLYRTLTAEQAKPIRLLQASTCPVIVFLNGTKVFASKTARRCRPGSDRIVVNLPRGTSRLLVKLCHGRGRCGYAFDIDGQASAAKPAPRRGGSRAAPPALLARACDEACRLEATILLEDRTPADVVGRRTAALLAKLTPGLAPQRAAEFARRLKALRNRPSETGAAADDYGLYEAACRLRRQIALANPLLDFDEILFIKRNFARINHMCDQYFGRNAAPGGGLYVLSDPFGPRPAVRDVLAGSVVEKGRLAGTKLLGGCFLSPDLSYDGREIVFAYTQCQGRDWSPESSFHVFRVGLDGKGLTQLTDGEWNGFDPCFLPNGRICFISERRGGFGRCHGRPVPTYTLHSMNPDGTDIRAISYHETNEWHPSVDNEGMIVYSRWDYVDRDSDIAHHPWITTPDGRDARALHGNFPVPPNGRNVRPWMELDVKAVPGSHKYVATAAPHHGQAFGSLVLLDPDIEDDDGTSQLRRLTPDVLFPEAEGPRGTWNFGTAWPLDEDFYLCVYSPDSGRGTRHGIYVVDSFGNRELIYRDEEIGCQSPMPLRPRPMPRVVPRLSKTAGPRRPAGGKAAEAPPHSAVGSAGAGAGDAAVACINTYDGPEPWPDGTKITALRVIQLFPKATARVDDPRIGIGAQSLARGVLGTVPVEPDGSAHFRLPAGKAVYFQALDARGMAVQSMRSLTYVQPGQRLVCQGCHERRWRSPGVPDRVPLALRRPPSAIRPDVDGSWPLLYPRLVQPVLDRRCVPCHEKNARAPDLSGAVTDSRNRRVRSGWSRSYAALAPMGHWFNGGNGAIRDAVHGGARSTPGRFGAYGSALFQMLDKGHNKLKLPDEDLHRITLWLDANTNFYGAYHETEKQARGEVVPPGIE